jgi:hypothetical protein
VALYTVGQRLICTEPAAGHIMPGEEVTVLAVDTLGAPTVEYPPDEDNPVGRCMRVPPELERCFEPAG